MQPPHDTQALSLTSQIAPEAATESFVSIVAARPAGPYAGRIVSEICLGLCAVPHRKTPSAAESTGLNFTWASWKKPSGLKGILNNLDTSRLVAEGITVAARATRSVSIRSFWPKIGSVAVTRSIGL